MKRLRLLTLAWFPCVLASTAVDTPAAAQDPDPLYESSFVEANGIRLQYMDFGGSGVPLIFVQDIHNYFEDEDPFFRDLWSAFYARFTDNHHVLATVKRGYGESDDPGWGYDVATQSEDLLGLMDALGIRQAVLVGRVPATQDLTWIAEHHPQRVAGLVYLGNPVVFQTGIDPEAQLFGENYTRGSCDLEERGVALGGARGPWRPHFLDDESVRIDLSALRFTHPVYDRRSMGLQRLDRLDAIAEAEPECPGHAESLEYFRALAADQGRRAALRETLEASDVSVPLDEGIERAFGSRMRTVVEPDLEGGWTAFHDFTEPHIRSFLTDVATAAVPSDTSEDRNQVELADPAHVVRDLGVGNQVTRADGVPRASGSPARRMPQAASAQEWTDPSPHSIRFVPVAPDVQLEVLDWGGEGTPLVFLAGLQMNAHAFDDLAPRFTDTHRVVGITRRGHGESSWPDDGYSLARLVEDLRIVLDTLALERVVFAGHSLAGTEVTRFASEHPERVAGLVYIDAAHDLTLIERHGLMAVCPMGPETLEAIERMFENPEAFRRTQRHEAPDGTSKPSVSDTAVAQIFAGLAPPDYSAVRAPALAVYHTPRWVEDMYGGEAALSQACIAGTQRYLYESIADFAGAMERGRVVALDDTQHNIHLVSPDALLEVMRRWLAELPDKR